MEIGWRMDEYWMKIGARVEQKYGGFRPPCDKKLSDNLEVSKKVPIFATETTNRSAYGYTRDATTDCQLLQDATRFEGMDIWLVLSWRTARRL